MISVKHIMAGQPISVTSDDSVRRVIGLMEQFRIGGLPVLDNQQLVGIITSRDVRRSHPNRLVADSMSTKVVTIEPHFSLWQAKKLMDDHGVERLVVMEAGAMAGLVTKTDLISELGKHVDALTGLYRSGYLNHKALELLDNGQEMVVIFLDLNHFGKIDKDFGHVIGDEILRQTGQVLKDLMENNRDYLCRYGGDEFAVVTSKPWEEAKKLAQEMIDALVSQAWPQNIEVTGTVGMAGGRLGPDASDRNKICAVSTLINQASLTSTRAKKEGLPLGEAGSLEL